MAQKEKQFNATISFLDKREWEVFKKLCTKLDTTASREIRVFVRTFKEKHKEELEKLF